MGERPAKRGHILRLLHERGKQKRQIVLAITPGSLV